MIMPAFYEWPTEAGIIARLLGGYGELEFELALCTGHAISDKRQGIRNFFAVRGETARIKFAKSEAKIWMRLSGLKEQFTRTLDAMRECKDIRNNLSHCHWASLKHDLPSDGLFYVNLERSAAASAGPIVYQWQHASFDRLREFEAFYRYASDCLWHVQGRIAAARGQPQPLSFVMPQKQKTPPKFVPAPPDSLALLPRHF